MCAVKQCGKQSMILKALPHDHPKPARQGHRKSSKNNAGTGPKMHQTGVKNGAPNGSPKWAPNGPDKLSDEFVRNSVGEFRLENPFLDAWGAPNVSFWTPRKLQNAGKPGGSGVPKNSSENLVGNTLEIRRTILSGAFVGPILGSILALFGG